MFDEQWQFAVEVERKYNQYRKKVMVRYDLSAAEVDVLLFLANNSQFDLAVDIVRVRKMQKSHVSLAVNKLCEKGYIQKETDAADRKKVHLKLEESASEIIRFGLPESVWRIVVFRNFQRRQGRISQIMRADSEERDGKIKTLKAREKNIIEK